MRVTIQLNISDWSEKLEIQAAFSNTNISNSLDPEDMYFYFKWLESFSIFDFKKMVLKFLTRNGKESVLKNVLSYETYLAP